MTDQTKKYGFYSEQHNKFNGHTLWLNDKGQIVEVSEVRSDPIPNPNFPDMHCVGCVTKFVQRVHTPGQNEKLDFTQRLTTFRFNVKE